MFAIGSVTKQFACACILLLAEEGKLSVDDKVAKYYPGLTSAKDITLYDLMTHTSGYPDYYPLDFVDRRLVKPIAEDALLAKYAGARLDFEPGERWSYSNTGYVLLGRVVEKVSGKPFGRFLEERVLEPLGMTHSAVGPGSERGGTGAGIHVVRPGAAGAGGAGGRRLAARRGRPVGVGARPGPLGPRPDRRPGARAGVDPPHDHAAVAEQRPAHALWLRPERAPGRRRAGPDAWRLHQWIPGHERDRPEDPIRRGPPDQQRAPQPGLDPLHDPSTPAQGPEEAGGAGCAEGPGPVAEGRRPSISSTRCNRAS